jgi:ribosomal protein S2
LVFNYFYKHLWAETIEDYIYFWYKRWSPGFLKNYSGFASMTMRVQYPNAIFYTNYTHNRDKFIEASERGILSFGLADSNSARSGYNFLINANEKTSKSYLYFINLIFLHAVRVAGMLQRELFFIY